MIEKTAIQCDKCLRADFCNLKQEFEIIFEEVRKLSFCVEDDLEFHNIDYIEIIAICKKFCEIPPANITLYSCPANEITVCSYQTNKKETDQ